MQRYVKDALQGLRSTHAPCPHMHTVTYKFRLAHCLDYHHGGIFFFDGHKYQALKLSLENFSGKSWAARILDHRPTLLGSLSHYFFSPGWVLFLNTNWSILCYKFCFAPQQAIMKELCHPSKPRICWITDIVVWFLYQRSFPVPEKCQICALQ